MSIFDGHQPIEIGVGNNIIEKLAPAVLGAISSGSQSLQTVADAVGQHPSVVAFVCKKLVESGELVVDSEKQTVHLAHER